MISLQALSHYLETGALPEDVSHQDGLALQQLLEKWAQKAGETAIAHLTQEPYLLLTPGPLTTSPTVRKALLRDWCTWDDDYKSIVQAIRHDLEQIAQSPDFTSVLIQGSGTFAVEALLCSVIPPQGKLLVLANGAYGSRMAQIAQVLKIPMVLYEVVENALHDPKQVAAILETDPQITHVGMIHCETTTGMLNPIANYCAVARSKGKSVIVDAMSSFGGIPIDLEQLGIDFLVSSANKCIQGVPGFGFVLARRSLLKNCQGYARSLSLDLYDQWQAMEKDPGKWRFTSPTHTVRAFRVALLELQEEGGVQARYNRYQTNQAALLEGMVQLGFEPLLPRAFQSPIITAFYHPEKAGYTFRKFYDALKQAGFVIYPGKVSFAESFRIGNIGHVFPHDIQRLLKAIAKFLQSEKE
jgi:2-aminoethylphosphonate-pyruvate transaminase